MNPATRASDPAQQDTPADNGNASGSDKLPIIVTALVCAVGLMSASASYYFGLDGVRENHPWYIVLGYDIFSFGNNILVSMLKHLEVRSLDI